MNEMKELTKHIAESLCSIIIFMTVIMGIGMMFLRIKRMWPVSRLFTPPLYLS
jgi:hypothetical protein